MPGPCSRARGNPRWCGLWRGTRRSQGVWPRLSTARGQEAPLSTRDLRHVADRGRIGAAVAVAFAEIGHEELAVDGGDRHQQQDLWEVGVGRVVEVRDRRLDEDGSAVAVEDLHGGLEHA